MVAVAPLTFIPIGVLVTVAVVPPVVTGADAVMLVAPSESTLAAFKVTEAIPPAFVRAVAEVGVNVTRPLVEAKLTTAPCISAPLASRSVAVAVTGVPNVTVLAEMLNVKLPEPVGVGVVPPEELLLSPGPSPQPQRIARKNREKINNGRRNFLVLLLFIIFLLL